LKASNLENLKAYAASTSLHFSQILAKGKHVENAWNQAQTAYAMFVSINNTIGQLNALDAMAAIKMRLKDFASAIDIFQKAIKLSKNLQQTYLPSPRLPDVNRREMVVCAETIENERLRFSLLDEARHKLKLQKNPPPVQQQKIEQGLELSRQNKSSQLTSLKKWIDSNLFQLPSTIEVIFMAVSSLILFVAIFLAYVQ
jgi:hypothetical protein